VRLTKTQFRWSSEGHVCFHGDKTC
jgi:hypothetical protein